MDVVLEVEAGGSSTVVMDRETASANPKERASNVSKKSASPRVTAEQMASKQRDISVSEFFAKNRHLLGFDNPRKALLTTVKEAVDNSLDACEEAGILPDITVVIEDLQPDRPASAKSSRYRITTVDNGPGIVRKQVENVFGRLLFGSKFHRLKMSRGQQGIGISAAGMYGLITTGKPMLIQTRPKATQRAHHIELAMNTKTNRAEVTVDEETDDFPLARLRGLSASVRELAEKDEFLSPRVYATGTSVSIELEGKYQKGRGSVDEFLELTAIANPHARITFVRPTRETVEEDEPTLMKGKKGVAAAGGTGVSPASETIGAALTGGRPAPDQSVDEPAMTTDYGDLVIFPRAVNELPPETKEIQPHPKGVELGTLLQMLKDFEEANKGGGTLYNFLQERFCRVSSATASEFCEKISTPASRVTSRTKVSDIEPPQAELLYKVFQEAKLAPPPTDCLAPIGVQQLLKGMFKGVRAEFYAASSREAEVYRGRPFLIETAIAFGGELPADEPARVIRFANRVPLLYQQSACSSFKAVAETNWKNYDLQQPRGSLPIGPLVIMIHMASVWVPFTSESKEAIADYDEIRKEMKLALMECGRKLGIYLRKRAKMRRESERRDVFERYIGVIAKSIHSITGEDEKKVYDALLAQAKKRTAIADARLDEEGKRVEQEDPADQEGVIIVEGAASAGVTAARGTLDDLPEVVKQSKKEAAALKVAALAKEEEREPTLLDVSKAKRQSAKGKMGEATAKPAKRAEPKGNPAAQPAEKAAKPKMRLVNGKLVPVKDEPGLF
jgi:DNA topoisomerase-6 subunit B